MIVFGGEGRNLSPPPDVERRACWELQGLWGKYLGTPIAPRWFLTAEHVGGQVGDAFILGETRHYAVARERILGTDLALWRVERPFPRWAELCPPDQDTRGRELFIVGRGTARGAELPGKGWHWGASDHRLSWGSNRVSGYRTSKPYGALLIATFDQGAGPDETTLSTGDSGGGVFLKGKDGRWRLAGINHDLNPGDDGKDRFYSPSGKKDELFRAALYDGRGLFLGPPDALAPVRGPQPQPAFLAAQRVSVYQRQLVELLARPDTAYPDTPPFFQTRLGRYGSGAALAGVTATTALLLLRRRRMR